MTDFSPQIETLRTEFSLSYPAAAALVAIGLWDGHAYRDVSARGAACGGFWVGSDLFDPVDVRELTRAKLLRKGKPAPQIADIVRGGAAKCWFRLTPLGRKAIAAPENPKSAA